MQNNVNNLSPLNPLFTKTDRYEKNAYNSSLFDDCALVSNNRSWSTRYKLSLSSIEIPSNHKFFVGSSYTRGGYGSGSGSSCDDEECVYIGVGVGCGVFVLVIVVLIVVFCYKGVLKVPNRCKSSKSSSKVETSENGDLFMDKY